MKGKGKQFVPHGVKVVMAFPGGAGYGAAASRAKSEVIKDLVLGYISAETAQMHYGLSQNEIADILAQAALGDMPEQEGVK
jgi:N-methylhydantoinase B